MITEQNVKELENSAIELTITVAQETLADSYTKIVQKYMKNLQIPGFRKGKVPASVLEQKFGKGMREEAVFTVIDEAVQEAIEKVEDDYKPLPYSSPNLVDEEAISTEVDSSLTFAVTYDVFPKFEAPSYTDHTIKTPKVVVSEEDVQAEIEKLRMQNVILLETENPAELGNNVTVDYVELDENQEEVPSTERKDFVFTLGSGTNFYKIDDDVVGMTVGEIKTIEKTYPEDHEFKEYAGKSVTLRIELKKVQKREVPELDDEFAQDVSEAYQSMEDLIKATREKLEKNLSEKLDQVKMSAIFDTLTQNIEIPIPESMIQAEIDSNWRRFISQFGMPEEQVIKYLTNEGKTKESFTEPWREDAKKSITLQLILEKIKEKENFTVSEEDLDTECETQLSHITDENTRKYYRTVVEEEMKSKLVRDFLLANNTAVEEGEVVPYAEFMATEPRS